MGIKRALVSVSDKTGIVEFCRELSALGVEIISTGGTKSLLAKEGVPVIGISDVTGFPEILDGRVKTLHPAVHSGLLAIRDSEEHQRQMQELGLDYIDLVVVNLYPFQETIAKPDVAYEDAIENIDIGGPTMLRSAAKTTHLSVLLSMRRIMARSLRKFAVPETRRLKRASGLRPKCSVTQARMTRSFPNICRM